MKLVIATKNRNKIIEITEKLNTIKGVEIRSLADYRDAPDVVEDGMSFEENARKKAIFISKFTGLPTLADDSGLVIDALGGEPGVHSARYGGTGLTDSDRNHLILERMKHIPVRKRTARFVCIIALAAPGSGISIAAGSCEGVILEEMRGSYGFGYDPIFYIPEFEKTMAEISLDVKNRISHRALALEKIRETIDNLNRRH